MPGVPPGAVREDDVTRSLLSWLETEIRIPSEGIAQD